MSHDAEAAVSIRDWHAGRLALVWVAAAAIYWFGRSVWRDEENLVGLAFLLVGFGSLFAAFVVSWVWFGGRERR